MTSEVKTEVGIRDLKKYLSDLVGRVTYGGEVVRVTKNGKQVAVLVATASYERGQRAIELVEGNPELKAQLDGE